MSRFPSVRKNIRATRTPVESLSAINDSDIGLSSQPTFSVPITVTSDTVHETSSTCVSSTFCDSALSQESEVIKPTTPPTFDSGLGSDPDNYASKMHGHIGISNLPHPPIPKITLPCAYSVDQVCKPIQKFTGPYSYIHFQTIFYFVFFSLLLMLLSETCFWHGTMLVFTLVAIKH